MRKFLVVAVVLWAMELGFVAGFVLWPQGGSFRSVASWARPTNLCASASSNETVSHRLEANQNSSGRRRQIDDKSSRKRPRSDQLGPSSIREGASGRRSTTPLAVIREVRQLGSSHQVDEWIQNVLSRDRESFRQWNIRSQIDLVKALQEKKAYDCIMMLLRQGRLGRPHVKVFTTAMFAMALSSSHRHVSIPILDLMDEQGVLPTSLTFVALLGSIDGPMATTQVVKRIEGYRNVQLSAEVFNSAIYACRRQATEALCEESPLSDWQAALNLLQIMRRKFILPTVKTYHAILQVLSRTGQVQMAKSIMQQLQSSSGLAPDDRVWAAAINVCAEAADYHGAIHFINEMKAAGHAPNLIHCTALLKALAAVGQSDIALQTLAMMTGQDADALNTLGFTLPPTSPDLVALNIVISACARAGDIEAALSILEKMKAGDFVDPVTGGLISLDRISYHNILSSCNEPKSAMLIVKEMRLSRRTREGAVPPTSVTYAHAINACQGGRMPDVECATTLIAWALDDGVQPTVYMFAPAIWAAQKSGNREAALEFFLQMVDLGCSPNAVAYNGVISALCESGDVEHALLLYDDMRSRGMTTNAAVFKRFALAIRPLTLIEERREYLERIMSLMDRSEMTAKTGGAIFEALIGVYGVHSMIDEALRTFRMVIGRVDGPCLRAILLACSLANPPRWEDAVSILHTSDIVEGSSGPGKIDQTALSNVIISCSKANKFQEALNLLRLYGRKHSDMTERSPSLSVVAMNSLIAACGRGERPDLALDVLNGMQNKYGVRPDTRSYRNAAIALKKAQHDQLEVKGGLATYEWWECALSLLRRMREEGMTPDVATYSATISACEAAGEWQRALGVLQAMMDDEGNLGDDESLLNLFCFNAAISACEKGWAWVEALEVYERMLDLGGVISPNVVTLNSLLVALENAGQKELAQTKYNEGRRLKIVNPWRYTRNSKGESVRAMDLHNFSSAMAKAAVRSLLDGYSSRNDRDSCHNDLLIVTGKGLHSEENPVLKNSIISVLANEYGIEATVDEHNPGRVIVPSYSLEQFLERRKW